MKSTVCYPAIDPKALMVSVIEVLRGSKVDESESGNWTTSLEEGDGLYTRIKVPAMLSGKVVDVEVMGYVAHNSGNNGWSGPMSSGDWVRLRLSPVHNGPNQSDERHLREFGKRTGGFFQVMDGYDWEWNDVSCPFDGVDNNKEALLTILGPDNSAAADEILEDRDVASALHTFLTDFLK